jgi:hypothetical protein
MAADSPMWRSHFLGEDSKGGCNRLAEMCGQFLPTRRQNGLRWTHTPEPVFRFHPRKGSNDLSPVGNARSLMIDTLRHRCVACLRSSPHRSRSVSQDFATWTPPRIRLQARPSEIRGSS